MLVQVFWYFFAGLARALLIPMPIHLIIICSPENGDLFSFSHEVINRLKHKMFNSWDWHSLIFQIHGGGWVCDGISCSMHWSNRLMTPDGSFSNRRVLKRPFFHLQMCNLCLIVSYILHSILNVQKCALLLCIA
jgi:hypothetical protein